MNERIHNYVEIKSLKDMINKTRNEFSDEVAFKFKTDVEGVIRKVKYDEFLDDVDSLGTKLIDLGLKGKKIAVISENRYEWATSYLAVVCGTGIIVPLDRALPEIEIRSLIERSEVEAIIYSDRYSEIMKKLINEDNKLNKIKYYICMDLEKKDKKILSFKELIRSGRKLINDGDKRFLSAEINPEEMQVMLFTSGTTSMSKAVALSHKNICANLMDIASVIEATEDDTFLSFLPLHHTFEATVGFLYPIYKGSSVAYCEGIKHIQDNLKEYKISIMISVPVLFENMYKRVMKSIEKQGKLEKVKKGIKISNFLRKFHIDIRRKIFKELHDNFGGNLRLFVSGAAAIDKEVEKGFNDLGITTYAGYGLTETSPVVAAENDKYRRYGSVGKVFPSLEVKIEDVDEEGVGEIVVKGPSVMLEYYNNPEATKEILVDGWFYTGDLGYFDKDKYLYISGRKKSVIVLKNGKNIYPEEIENLINKLEGIKESMVFGLSDKDDKNDLVLHAKIVYDKNIIKEIIKSDDFDEIKKYILNYIKEINKQVPAYKAISVNNVIFTEEELIKTTTLKIKRHEEMKKIMNVSN